MVFSKSFEVRTFKCRRHRHFKANYSLNPYMAALLVLMHWFNDYLKTNLSTLAHYLTSWCNITVYSLTIKNLKINFMNSVSSTSLIIYAKRSHILPRQEYLLHRVQIKYVSLVPVIFHVKNIYWSTNKVCITCYICSSAYEGHFLIRHARRLS